MTISRQTRGKQEERCQQISGSGASMGRGCTLRGKGRVKWRRGRGIDTTTSRQMRDYPCGSKSDGNGNGDGDGKCRALPSRDLAATVLVLAAEAAAVLIVDDTNGGNR